MGAKWLDKYDINDADHAPGLEAGAAIHEFKGKLPRKEAEKQAHRDYVREQAFDAASHHVMGMRAARAANNDKAAAKHGQHYAAAMKTAGENPFGEIHPEVEKRVKEHDGSFYRFKGHDADEFIENLSKPSPETEEEKAGAEIRKGLAELESLIR